MNSLQQAEELILAAAVSVSKEYQSIVDSLGRVLAEEVFADIDLPAFSRATMDGYACKRVDLGSELRIIATLSAGEIPQSEVQSGECIKIMTGAPLPHGADVVFKVEETRQTQAGHVRFTGLHSDDNISYQAEFIKKGATVLQAGTLLRAPHIAVLASVGRSRVMVARLPHVGIIASGDEIIEPHEVPALGQVRNSSSLQIAAQLQEMGLASHYYGIVRDSRASGTAIIEKALSEQDLTLITGGVSMGESDYIKDIINHCCDKVPVRSIAIKPGKPTIFGYRGGAYLFGLPGNPLSTFTIFEMLVKPFLYQLMGHAYKPRHLLLPLAVGLDLNASDRQSLLPIFIDKEKVYPVSCLGSAHIHSLVYADGFMNVGPNTCRLDQGELVHVRLL